MRKWLKEENIQREKNLSKESLIKKNMEKHTERKEKVVIGKVPEKQEMERKSLGVPERGEKLRKRPDLPQTREEAQEVKGTGIVTRDKDKENKKKVPGIWEKWRKLRESPRKEGDVKVRTNLLKNSEGGTKTDKKLQ